MTAEDDDMDEPIFSFDPGLSQREIILIGTIVALWSHLRREIFIQTASSFGSQGQLPEELNDGRFTTLLRHWRDRVIANASQERKEVLEEQHRLIVDLNDIRQAIVESMWEWDDADPEKIKAVGPTGSKAESVAFDAASLQELCVKTRRLLRNVMSPGPGAQLPPGGRS